MNEEINRLHKEDAALVRAFQAGNRDAFDDLVLKHQHRVFNLCYRFLGDYQDANDLAQDTFVKVYQSLKRFRLESTFSTWLYRIAVNTSKNRLKSLAYKYKRKTVSLNSPERPENPAPAIEIRDETQSPMMELERKERLTFIQKAIDTLPAEQKTIVVLSDIEGLSYDEIATVTGHKLGTVKSKLARARLDLRKKLRRVI